MLQRRDLDLRLHRNVISEHTRRPGRVELPVALVKSWLFMGPKSLDCHVFGVHCIKSHSKVSNPHAPSSTYTAWSRSAHFFVYLMQLYLLIFLDPMGSWCSVSIPLLSCSLVSMYFEERLHDNQNASGRTETGHLLSSCQHCSHLSSVSGRWISPHRKRHISFVQRFKSHHTDWQTGWLTVTTLHFQYNWAELQINIYTYSISLSTEDSEDESKM